MFASITLLKSKLWPNTFLFSNSVFIGFLFSYLQAIFNESAISFCVFLTPWSDSETGAGSSSNCKLDHSCICNRHIEKLSVSSIAYKGLGITLKASEK